MSLIRSFNLVFGFFNVMLSAFLVMIGLLNWLTVITLASGIICLTLAAFGKDDK